MITQAQLEYWYEISPEIRGILKEYQDKLHRRNMQIKELKKHYIGHLSIKELEGNAIKFLTRNGYKVEKC